MKIIEALKKIKDTVIKLEDLKKKKIAFHCADVDYETPVYPDQASGSKDI